MSLNRDIMQMCENFEPTPEENGRIFAYYFITATAERRRFFFFSRAPRPDPKYPLFFIVTRVKQPKRPLYIRTCNDIDPRSTKNKNMYTWWYVYIYTYTLSVVAHLRWFFIFKGPRAGWRRGCLKNIILYTVYRFWINCVSHYETYLGVFFWMVFIS